MSVKNLSTVSIIIPAYNANSDYLICLQSMLQQDYPNFEILWVDSNSSDGSPEKIAEAFPDIRIIKLDYNAGYRGGVNIGAKQAKGEILIVCNQDVEVAPAWISELVACLNASEQVAAVAPLILFFDKRTMVNEAGNTFHFSGLYGSRGLYHSAQEYQATEEIGTVSGCAFAIKRSVWNELEGFSADFDCYDTHFHAGVEDLDLCWRARQRGYKIMLNPRALMFHKYEHKGWHGARLNSLFFSYQLTFLRNFELSSLILLSPLLIFLQGCFWIAAAVDGMKTLRMLISSQFWIVSNFSKILTMRQKVQRARTRPDSVIFPFMSPTLVVSRNKLFQSAFDAICLLFYRIFRYSQPSTHSS